MAKQSDHSRLELQSTERQCQSNNCQTTVSLVHQSNHTVDFKNIRVVGLEANYHKRLFLEAWHLTEDPNAGNHHIKIPEA